MTQTPCARRGGYATTTEEPTVTEHNTKFEACPKVMSGGRGFSVKRGPECREKPSERSRQALLNYFARRTHEDSRRNLPVRTVTCVSCNRPLFNTALTQGWVDCPCGATFSLQRALAVTPRAKKVEDH